MDKIEKFKASAKKFAMATAKAVKTGVSTLIDVAEEVFKYYDAHKNTLNRIGLALLGAGAFRWLGGRPDDTRYMTRDDREKRFYDARTGRYVYARRKPNSFERMEIDKRYAAGESYISILNSLGILD